MQERAQDVAKIRKEISFPYAKYSLLYLCTPAVAAEHDPIWPRTTCRKGVSAVSSKVRTEIQLERMKLMDKKWELLEEKKVLRASTEAALFEQLNGKR